MRILHVIKTMDVVGGAERLLSEILQRETDHYILIWAGESSHFNLPQDRVIRVRGLGHALWYIWLALVTGKFDRFHFHLFPSIYLAILFGKRSIIHEHNSYNRRRRFSWISRFEQLVYSRAGAVVCISHGVERSLLTWLGGRIENTYVVSNFVVQQDKLEPRGDNNRSSESMKVIGMAGSFTQQKNQKLLIEALQHLPDTFILKFAGDGDERSACKQFAADLGVGERVCFLGAVSDVVGFYRSLDLHVLASHWEGFGLVVVEAALAGCPSLISNVPGLSELAISDEFLINMSDAESLASQIRSVIDIEVTQEELLKKYDYYTFSRFKKEMHNVYVGMIQ